MQQPRVSIIVPVYNAEKYLERCINSLKNQTIKDIEISIKENPLVDEVVYDSQLVDLVNKNIKTISFWILIISGVFAFISILLINSSLRLSIYSKRFIIKTMQMVGATKSFIRKPFIVTSVKLGVIGSVLAIVGILALTAYADSKLPTLGLLSDVQSIVLVCGTVFIVGIIITYISTYFATQRFLNHTIYTCNLWKIIPKNHFCSANKTTYFYWQVSQ